MGNAFPVPVPAALSGRRSPKPEGWRAREPTPGPPRHRRNSVRVASPLAPPLIQLLQSWPDVRPGPGVGSGGPRQPTGFGDPNPCGVRRIDHSIVRLRCSEPLRGSWEGFFLSLGFGAWKPWGFGEPILSSPLALFSPATFSCDGNAFPCSGPRRPVRAAITEARGWRAREPTPGPPGHRRNSVRVASPLASPLIQLLQSWPDFRPGPGVGSGDLANPRASVIRTPAGFVGTILSLGRVRCLETLGFGRTDPFVAAGLFSPATFSCDGGNVSPFPVPAARSGRRSPKPGVGEPASLPRVPPAIGATL